MKAGSEVPAESPTQYLHRDHLGSVDAVTPWGFASASQIQRYSFDAWGKGREAYAWQPYTPLQIAEFQTDLTNNRGFTGHEMLDPVGLVHMNGRVYDPEIGRFLSADPFVQDPSNLQSWNRYSYVINNPLSLTDPSGFFFSGLLKSLWGGLKSMFSMIGRTPFLGRWRLRCAEPAASGGWGPDHSGSSSAGRWGRAGLPAAPH